MPTLFRFNDQSFQSDTTLTLSQFTPGNYAGGINQPTFASAVAPFQFIDDSRDVDVIAVTLMAGQSYLVDVDDGAGDRSGGSVDLAFDVINSQGDLLLRQSSGPSSGDPGSFSTRDPAAVFTAVQSGIYYIAVHDQDVRYDDGEFRFQGSGDTGDYRLNITGTGIPRQTVLSDASNDRSYGDTANNVAGRGGNDDLRMGGGNDIASGGDGNDTLGGGAGSDQLSGDAGRDRLIGWTGNDVLVGGSGNDYLSGNDGLDTLQGNSGNDLLGGGAGSDVLQGGTGRDQIFGDSGDDFVRGGRGIDTLWGGAGEDRFQFLRGDSNFDSGGSVNNGFNEDRIRDFDTSGSDADTIDLSYLSAGDLTFRGSNGFTGDDQVRVLNLGQGYQEVQVNLDSDRTPEQAFLVHTLGNVRLDANDFDL